MAKTGRIDDSTRFTRALITPEGIDIGVRLASAGERASAFVIDALIIGVTMILLTIAAGAAGQNAGSSDVVAIVWLIGFFVVRNFYFLIFELGARGATPGKRLLRIRVANRTGGALRPDAIFARNAMRELELFLPLSFMASAGASIDAVITLMGVVWTGIFVFFPLFNKDRLRAGDVIAGTWVVQAPRRRLVADLAMSPMDRRLPARQFTLTQLGAYGIKELQVLEDVLRAGKREAIATVADRIRKKIGWARTVSETDRDFLSAYYAELRRHLESDLLMGKRRADKHDRASRMP
jgi:uncharacterized RDD family membrane protein YckC